jgi:hypothetical protein
VDKFYFDGKEILGHLIDSAAEREAWLSEVAETIGRFFPKESRKPAG